MRAAALTTIPAVSFQQVELPDPAPAPGEAVLAVEACGICGTDLHIVAGESYAPALPFVLGHEPVGRVAGGGLAAITLFEGCGVCRECTSGDARLCQNMRSIAGVLGRHGGFAERLVVPAAQIVPVPDGLSAAEAASLTDAGPTAANAVRCVAGARGPCVVIGGGPVGFLVAEMLRAEGQAVTVVERLEARRAALEAIGHTVTDTTEGLEAPGIVIDCAPAPALMPWALDALEPHGMFVVVGYGPVPDLDLAPVARKELRIAGVRSGSRADLERALGLAAEGRIRLPEIAVFPLARIDEAFAALRAGTLAGKAVIVP
jgi:2-desacetyl-2-hydroxyethyl bacteriochlorophyllide A dehydrogenase